MGFIYLITNKINNRVYIGQTKRNIEQRWKEHLRHCELNNGQILGKAILKYGIDNFMIQELEQCDDTKLDEREKFWIKEYNSYYNGYNATYGGSSNFIMTNRINEVKELWDNGLGQKAIVEKTKLNVETVHNYLMKSGISKKDIRERQKELIKKSKSKMVFQYDLEYNFIKEWPSLMEVERNTGINHRNISAVCNKKRKTAGGYIWSYTREEK